MSPLAAVEIIGECVHSLSDEFPAARKELRRQATILANHRARPRHPAPVGIGRGYPIETLTLVADYYQGTDLPVLTKKRITGLRRAATDGPFKTGSGPLVSGTTLALTMAMTGRRACCDELHGDGSATLRERCEAFSVLSSRP